MIDWGDSARQTQFPSSLSRVRGHSAVAPSSISSANGPMADEGGRLLHFSGREWVVRDADADAGFSAGIVHDANPDLLPTPAALAELIVARLYRYQTLDDQCAAMTGDGVPATRILLAGWINRAAERLAPLARLIAEEGRTASLVASANMSFGHCYGQNRRLWLFHASGESAAGSHEARPPLLWVCLTPDRLGSYALQELEGFAGRLQAPALSGYDRVANASGQVLIGCWSEVRARAEDLAARAPHAFLDHLLLAAFRLRAIEAQIENSAPEAAKAARDQESRLVIAELGQQIAVHRAAVDPFSILGGFLHDLHTSWLALTWFLDDGRVALENKAAFRLRKMLVPDNRWVFGRRQDSRNSAATLYTLSETCALNGIEPAEYLAWALSQLRTEQVDQQLQALLPWRFQTARPPDLRPRRNASSQQA